MDLQEMAARLEIMEVLARYAHAVDRKEFHLWIDVFTEDAVLDYSQVGWPVGTRDELIAGFGAAMSNVPMTQHFISNVECEFQGNDRAKVTAMFYNPMLLPGMAEQSYCGGYYHHEFVCTASGWRSTHLVEENTWFVNRPQRA